MLKRREISNGVNQKGQIEIIVIFLLLIGAILFYRSGIWGIQTKEPEIAKSASVAKISKPLIEKPISPPQEQKTSLEEKIELQETKKNDTTPPRRSNPYPKGELPTQTRKTIISLKTDERAICRYGLVSELSYDSMQNIFSNTNATSHSTQIAFLSEGEEYTFYVKCIDEFENKNIDDFKISFKVKAPEDKTPPQRKWLSPQGMLPAETTQVELTVGTDEKANCYYSTLQGESFRGKAKSFSPSETKTFHSAKVYSLTPGKVYDYFVRCCDFRGNCNDGDVMIRFGVGVSP